MNRPFHYSFKVTSLEQARQFYAQVLGCREGRSCETWIDFDFFGNQLSAHLADQIEPLEPIGQVDGVKVPIPHFGAVISIAEFDRLRYRLQAAGIRFVIDPYLRYEGLEGQQHTMFVLDPSGNPIEFKAFVDPHEVFKGHSPSEAGE